MGHPRHKSTESARHETRAALLGALLTCLVVLLLPGTAIAASFSSDFETGTEGWTTFLSDPSNQPTYHTGGGDPGNYISGTDTESIEQFGWNFNAPPSWSGDMRANYGGEIKFSQRHPTAAFASVAIFGHNGGELIGVARKDAAPGNVWATYSFELQVGKGSWDCNDAYGDPGSGTFPADLNCFRNVLRYVDKIIVGGDLDSTQVGEETDLDTVRVTEPASAPDSDGDGVGDIVDNCPSAGNPAQRNADGDAQGDICDADDDNDGVSDASDNCPTSPGTSSNGGCPAPPPDTTPPQTTIKKTTVNKAKRKATFRFFSSERGSKFLCKLDTKPYKSCTSPRTYKKLKVGHHTFKVRARDAAGNSDPSAAVKKFKIRRRRNR